MEWAEMCRRMRAMPFKQLKARCEELEAASRCAPIGNGVIWREINAPYQESSGHDYGRSTQEGARS